MRLNKHINSYKYCVSVRLKILTWIENWLLNRKRVVVNGKLAWLIDVLSGVVSISGALLFVIFINDLDDGVINKLLKFPDDTKLLVK